MVNHYVQSMLGDREQVIHVAHQHWFVFFRSIVFELVFAAAIIAAVVIIQSLVLISPFTWLGLILLLIPGTGLLQDYLNWANKEYIITNRRVMQIAGVLNKNVTDSSLEKVNDVKLSQSMLGRVFNYGDIEILTASELGVNQFHRIGNPIQFKTAMLNAKENLGLDHDQAPLRSTPQSSDDVPSLLEELDHLRQKGVISEEEFQVKKSALLSKI
ncbi:MAG: PH domain-containing protein [Anaerolineaceae bacterium]|nr:PH domain-containing protein [Anaerolineaceae bacterium]